MVAIDGLRADCTGRGESAPTPALDALARSGATFERAYAASSFGPASLASLFTGRAPARHGVVRHDRKLGAEHETLAEALAGRGWSTAAVISDFRLGATRGLGQGFARCVQVPGPGPGALSSEGAAKEALKLMREAAASPSPSFLFVQLSDPLPPWGLHPRTGFAPDGGSGLTGEESLEYLQVMARDLSPAEREGIETLYRGEVRAADMALERMLAELKRLALEDRALVLVTSLEGVEIMDRGRIGCAHGIREELVRVPLVARGPGIAPGRRLSAPVSLCALAPTVLEFAGGGAGERRFDADSLLERLRGGATPADGVAFFEIDYEPAVPGPGARGVHERGLATARWKLVEDARAGTLALFDLSLDPREARDLARERGDVAQALLPSLRAWSASSP